MKQLAILVAAIMFFSVAALTGQEREIILSENSVKSLSNGINSENVGLKKSAISMVGRYKLRQVCPILIQQFANETDLGYKLMIAEMIYDVGCPDAISNFQIALKDEQMEELQYFCKILHENYLFANNYEDKLTIGE